MKDKNEVSPATVLAAELRRLRRDLKTTSRSYTTRLEEQLALVARSLSSDLDRDDMSKERAHRLRDMTTLLRKRKGNPAKGRRKDLREIDSIIRDLHLLSGADGNR